MSRLTPELKATLSCFIGKIVKDLNRHHPWVIKDPRMLLLADHWIPRVQIPQLSTCAPLLHCTRLVYSARFSA